MAYRIHSISCRSDAATSKEVVSFNTIHHLENKSNLPANTGSGPCGLASSPPPKKFIFDITQVYNKQIEYMIGLLSKANKFCSLEKRIVYATKFVHLFHRHRETSEKLPRFCVADNTIFGVESSKSNFVSSPEFKCLRTSYRL